MGCGESTDSGVSYKALGLGLTFSLIDIVHLNKSVNFLEC